MVRCLACDESLQVISAPTWLLRAPLCQQSQRRHHAPQNVMPRIGQVSWVSCTTPLPSRRARCMCTSRTFLLTFVQRSPVSERVLVVVFTSVARFRWYIVRALCQPVGIVSGQDCSVGFAVCVYTLQLCSCPFQSILPEAFFADCFCAAPSVCVMHFLHR